MQNVQAAITLEEVGTYAKIYMLLLCFLISASSWAEEKPVLTWLISDPGVLPESAQKIVTTESNFLVQMLIQAMPEYQHEFIRGNILRIEYELRTGVRTCYPGSSEKEKRGAYTYATDLSISPPLKIIMNRELAAKINPKNKTLSLQTLIDHKLHGLLMVRSYGTNIDEILDRHPADIDKINGGPYATNIIKMIEHHRADYTIEYEFILKSLIDAGEVSSDLVALPLKAARQFTPVYLICSKNEEGLRIITKANRIIRSRVQGEDFRQFLMREDPAAATDGYISNVNDFISGRAHHDYLWE